MLNEMCSTDLSLSSESQTQARDAEGLLQRLNLLQAALNQVILGKADVIEKLLIALLAQGHVLLEDVPGIGKTTLAKAFAYSLDCQFRRIQFTPDLLPSDVIGTSIYSPTDERFHFQAGPIFTQILMADEINRASPRTQSSLLEAMAEQQVSIDGQQLNLPPPFMVIATQNPLEYQGTYPLPEAQLDRFMMCLALGYPAAELELQMLVQPSSLQNPNELTPLLSQSELLNLQQRVAQIHVDPDLGLYLMKLITLTRACPELELGVSPRGGLALIQAAKARAFLKGRDFILPEDLQILAVPVLAHRVLLSGQAALGGRRKTEILEALLGQVPPPPLK